MPCKVTEPSAEPWARRLLAKEHGPHKGPPPPEGGSALGLSLASTGERGCLPGTRRSRLCLIPCVEAQPHSRTARGPQRIRIMTGSRTRGSPCSGVRVSWERGCGQESNPYPAQCWPICALSLEQHTALPAPSCLNQCFPDPVIITCCSKATFCWVQFS